MNNKQNAKLNMGQRVSDTLKKYSAVYNEIAPMVIVVGELNGLIADIREADKEQISVNVSASTQEKRAAESKMIDACVKVANVLYVIGFTTDDKELTTLTGLNPNSFYNLEGNAELNLAKRILTLAQGQAETLKTYGIDAAEIEAMGSAIEVFQAVIVKPLDMIGARKQKTTNLKQLFASLNSVLYDKLDKLIVLFKANNPDFYGEYRTARNYIETSVRHQK